MVCLGMAIFMPTGHSVRINKDPVKLLHPGNLMPTITPQGNLLLWTESVLSTKSKGNIINYKQGKNIWSRVVLKKGVGPCSIKVFFSDMILFTGHKQIIRKSDGEAAIRALKEAAKHSTNFDLGVEVNPVGDSRANGEVERAIETAGTGANP